MNYGKLTAGTTKTAIDTAKPSEKGEIITYLSRRGDVLDQPLEADDEIIVLVKGVDIFRCGQDPHIMFSEVVDKECCLRSVTAQAGQVFNDDRLDLARLDHLIDFVDALTVEVHTADIIIEGFAHHLVAVADGKVIYDFPLVIQRIQFFILISGQPIIEPDFHNRSFPLWCADHARHTIAHNFLNSYQNKSGDFCFYFSNKIGGSICIWMIHRQIVVDHHFQKIIKLIVRTHIGIHDACDIGFFSLSTHSAPFFRNQFGQ